HAVAAKDDISARENSPKVQDGWALRYSPERFRDQSCKIFATVFMTSRRSKENDDLRKYSFANAILSGRIDVMYSCSGSATASNGASSLYFSDARSVMPGLPRRISS